MSHYWPNDCSGSWSGYYVHDAPTHADRSYPIHAELRQIGDRLEGEMTDELTETRLSLHKVVEATQDRMSEISQAIFASALQRYPQAIVHSSLPSASILRGRVRDDTIAFTKSYQGPQLTRLKEGEVVFGASRLDRHCVHYSGTIDWASQRIEGTWLIRRRGLFGRFLPPAGTGMFSLERVN